MQITDVRIKKIETDGKLKGIASIVFDNCLVIHGIKIIENNGTTFISMPSNKTVNGEFLDIAHPINSNMRNILQDTILEEYYKLGE